MDTGVTPEGLRIPTYEQIYGKMRDRYLELSGQNIDNDPVGKAFYSVVAFFMSMFYLTLQKIVDMFDPDNATGVFLRNLGSITGHEQKGATKCRGYVSLSGTPGTVIRKGIVVATTADPGFYFDTTEAVTLNETGVAMVGVVARNAGAKTIQDLEPWKIVTAIEGLSGVHGSGFIDGEDQESEEEYRERMKTPSSRVGSATRYALEARVNALPFVSSAVVIENNKLDVTDAFGVTPRDYGAFVWPSTLSTREKEEIAEVLLIHEPVSTNSCGDVGFRSSVLGTSIKNKEVRFSYANNVSVYVNIAYTRSPKFPPEAREALEMRIGRHFENLEIGESVSYSRLLCLILDTGWFEDVDLQIGFGEEASALGRVSLPIGKVQKASFATLGFAFEEMS